MLAVVTPGGSYLAAIPALAGGLAAIVRVSTDSELLGAVSSVIGAAIGLVILAPTVVLFFPALGLEMAAAPALLATLALFTVLPVVDLLLPPTDGPKRRLRGARRDSGLCASTRGRQHCELAHGRHGRGRR